MSSISKHATAPNPQHSHPVPPGAPPRVRIKCPISSEPAPGPHHVFPAPTRDAIVDWSPRGHDGADIFEARLSLNDSTWNNCYWKGRSQLHSFKKRLPVLHPPKKKSSKTCYIMELLNRKWCENHKGKKHLKKKKQYDDYTRRTVLPGGIPLFHHGKPELRLACPSCGFLTRSWCVQIIWNWPWTRF